MVRRSGRTQVAHALLQALSRDRYLSRGGGRECRRKEGGGALIGCEGSTSEERLTGDVGRRKIVEGSDCDASGEVDEAFLVGESWGRGCLSLCVESQQRGIGPREWRMQFVQAR